LKHSNLSFFVEHRATLEELNVLRNRIWHRGTMVLRYPALDEFIGRFVLPVVRLTLALPEYANSRNWRWTPIRCGIDLLDEIDREFAKASWSLEKLAYLKELGRAAYANPLLGDPFFRADDERRRKHAHLAAKSLGVPRLCPVCGVDALVAHEDVDVDDEHADEANPANARAFVWMVKCECCSFNVHQELGSPSTIGLPLEPYFA
jgi:hypothetical protein